MEQIIGLIGIFTVCFAVLASTNALKKYTKQRAILWIAHKHRLFGAISVLLAFSHMVLAIIEQSFRWTGLLAIIALLLTGLFGGLFYQLKKKAFYIAHRALAMTSIFLIVIHIILNSRM